MHPHEGELSALDRDRLLDHFAASFLAAAAFFAAHLHVLVVREFFAFHGTPGTGLRAGRAGEVHEGTSSRHKLRGHSADVGTIEACLQRGQVNFLPLGHAVCAVQRACVTTTLTVGTRFGARVEFITVATAVGRLASFTGFFG